MQRVHVKARLEICDHDGYCSGAETEYTDKIINRTFRLPKKFKEPHTWFSIGDHDWGTELEKRYPPQICKGGSKYCDIDSESKTAGIMKHDFRFTVLEVNVVVGSS